MVFTVVGFFFLSTKIIYFGFSVSTFLFFFLNCQVISLLLFEHTWHLTILTQVLGRCTVQETTAGIFWYPQPLLWHLYHHPWQAEISACSSSFVDYRQKRQEYLNHPEFQIGSEDSFLGN